MLIFALEVFTPFFPVWIDPAVQTAASFDYTEDFRRATRLLVPNKKHKTSPSWVSGFGFSSSHALTYRNIIVQKFNRCMKNGKCSLRWLLLPCCASAVWTLKFPCCSASQASVIWLPNLTIRCLWCSIFSSIDVSQMLSLPTTETARQKNLQVNISFFIFRK